MQAIKDKSKYLEELKEKPKCECHAWKRANGPLRDPYDINCAKHGDAQVEAVGRFYGKKKKMDQSIIYFELNLCGPCAEQSAINAEIDSLPFWEL